MSPQVQSSPSTAADPTVHDVSNATQNGWTVSIGMQDSDSPDYSQVTASSYDVHHFVATASYAGSLDPERQYSVEFVDETTGTAFASCTLPADPCLGGLMDWYSGPQHPVSAVVVSTKADGSGRVEHASVAYTGWYARGAYIWYQDYNPYFYAGDGLSLTIKAWNNADITLDADYAIYVQDVTTGQILTRCTTNPCSLDATYYTGLHSFRTWLADANDPTQHVVVSTLPMEIPRGQWGAYGVGEDDYPVGSRVLIDGWVNQDVGLTDGHYFQYIMDVTTNTVVKRCDTGDTCQAWISLNSGHLYGNRVAGPGGPYDDVQAVSDHTMYFSTDGPTESQPLGGGGYRLETSGGTNPSQYCVQCHRLDPVNVVTGEFWETASDLTVSSQLSLQRSYGSTLASADGPFGYGSSSNWGMRLQIGAGATGATLADAGQIVVVQENGSFVSFARDIDGRLRAAGRVHAALTQNADGSFVFVRNDGTTFTFDADGFLTSVADRNGNTVTVSDAGEHPTRIQDSHARVLALTWDGDHISSATDQTGRSVTYAYDSNGDLASVTDVTGATTAYAYDNHRAVTITGSTGATTTNTYDADGRVTQQTDALGKATTLSYTGDPGSGHTVETDPTGTVTDYVYDQGEVTSATVGVGTPQQATTTSSYWAGQLVALTDPLGHTSTYTYDWSGNRTSSTDPLGRVSTATYNTLNEPLTVTNPAGQTTTSTYDDHGNLLTSTDPTGAATTFIVNPDGTVANMTDPTEATTSYTYDQYQHPATTTDPLGAVTTTSYDSLGRLLTTVDPRGHQAGANPADYTTTVTYDPAGRPLTTTDPLGGVATRAYDPVGNITSWTDQLGKVTTATYDLAGHLLTRTDPAGDVTTWTYDAGGRLVTSTDADGHTTSYGYDPLGRLTTTTDPLGRATTTDYDAAGHVTAVAKPSGAVTAYGYDAAGQQTSSTDPLGHQTSTSYDQAGRPTTVTDALGRATTTGYDADGRITSLHRADGSALAWGYDPSGHQTSYTDASGAITSYGYDPAGRQTSTIDTGGRLTSLGYDLAGNQTTTTYPGGGVATNSYDALNRLVSVAYSDTTPAQARTYDAASRLVTATAGTHTSDYIYDQAGRVAQVTTDAATVGYQWSAAGRLDQLTYPSGQTVQYGYDAAGQMTTVADWAARQYTYTWTDDGQLSSLTYPNGVTTHYGYDTAGHTLGITTSRDAGSQLLALAYSYDAAGELTSQSADRTTGPRATPTASVTTSSYTWDPLGRINQVTGVGAGGYDFTAAGQISQLADGRTLAYDQAGQLTTMTTPATPTSPAQSTSFTYDERGNRLTATTGSANVTNTYDLANHLASATTTSGTVSYTYDAAGLRASTTTGAGTQHFVWNTLAAVPTLLSDSSNLYVYGLGGTALAQVAQTDGAVHYFHADLIGSVRTVTAGDGTIAADADYTPYGSTIDVTADSLSGITPFGYAGQYTDATGNLYMRSRYYDPATAQFLGRDPFEPVTADPYGYASGDPLLRIDPLGLIDWPAVGVGVGVGALVALGVACVATVICGVAAGVGGGVTLTVTAGTATVAGVAAAGAAAGGIHALGSQGALSLPPLHAPSLSTHVWFNQGSDDPSTETCRKPSGTPNFEDPSQPPGPDWVWRGGEKGGWYNESTKETLRPDLNHPDGIEPHYDWREPDRGPWNRIYPDGTIEPKVQPH